MRNVQWFLESNIHLVSIFVCKSLHFLSFNELPIPWMGPLSQSQKRTHEVSFKHIHWFNQRKSMR